MRNKITQSTNNPISKFKGVLLAVPIGLLAYWVIGLLASPVRAQSAIPLIVAPARQSLTADPGKTVGFAIRFYNTGTEPLSGTFKAADFIVNNNQGSPVFLEGPTVLSSRYAAAKWVKLSSEKGTIPAAGMVTIQGQVNVPADAAPGGKYFAIFFEPDASIPSPSGVRQEETSSVSVRIAGLIYMRVSGPISEGANIIKFTAPGFSEYGPVDITTQIKNNGDYHITPKGTIVVKDMFGHEVAQAELAETNIFPDTSREIVSKLGTKWMIGRFTASLSAVYGEGGKQLASSLAFWVFPWKLAIVIVLAIIIIILTAIIIGNKIGKKQKKLEEELTEEKEELEKLKDALKDKISEVTSSVIPTEEKK